MLTTRQALAVLVGVLIAVAAWAGFKRAAPLAPELPTLEANQSNSLAEEEAAPFWIVERADELALALEEAPYVSQGRNGPVLYVVTFRDCPSCLSFKAAELERLNDIGVDIRWIVYARADRDGASRSGPEERALVAELAMTRNYKLFEAWYAVSAQEYYQTATLPLPADGDPERTAALDAQRELVGETLKGILADNGEEIFIPTMLWKETGGWRGYVGYAEESFAAVRKTLKAMADQSQTMERLPAP